MQAFPFRSGGMAASSVAENLASSHQQATSKRPAAETAQSFGWPHRGKAEREAAGWSRGLGLAF